MSKKELDPLQALTEIFTGKIFDGPEQLAKDATEEVEDAVDEVKPKKKGKNNASTAANVESVGHNGNGSGKSGSEHTLRLLFEPINIGGKSGTDSTPDTKEGKATGEQE